MRIGYQPDFAPFTWREGSAAHGNLVDLLRRALEQIGQRATFAPVRPGNMERALDSGRIDVYCCVGVTPERARSLRLSPALAMTGAAWFRPRPRGARRSRSGEPQSVVTPKDGPLFPLLHLRFPHQRVHTRSDYRSSLAWVLDGQAEAAALNWQAGWHVAEREFPGQFVRAARPFLRLPLAAAYAGTVDDALVTALNSAISRNRALARRSPRRAVARRGRTHAC